MLQSALDPALTVLHAAVAGLAGGLAPLLGTLAVPAALVLVTLGFRTLLLPLSFRAARSRHRLAAVRPALRELRRRHRHDPARLTRETRATYQAAGVSPLAPLPAALAQVPILILLYRLCVTPVVSGAPNIVVGANLWGAPLAERVFALVLAWPMGGGTLVAGGLLLLLAVVATAAAVRAVRTARGAAGGGEVPAAELAVARLAPFAVVVAATAVPLAVALYLAVSTTWLVAEQEMAARLPA